MIESWVLPATILLVILLTTGVLLGLWFFGKMIFNQRPVDGPYFEHLFVRLFDHSSNKNDWSWATRSIIKFLDDYFERRNDFWTSYGQIVICIFIVCIIAILLLTKVISAEAGLPILSAISGFAIAKGANIRNGGDFNPPTNNNG